MLRISIGQKFQLSRGTLQKKLLSFIWSIYQIVNQTRHNGRCLGKGTQNVNIRNVSRKEVDQWWCNINKFWLYSKIIDKKEKFKIAEL